MIISIAPGSPVMKEKLADLLVVCGGNERRTRLVIDELHAASSLHYSDVVNLILLHNSGKASDRFNAAAECEWLATEIEKVWMTQVSKP